MNIGKLKQIMTFRGFFYTYIILFSIAGLSFILLKPFIDNKVFYEMPPYTEPKKSDQNVPVASLTDEDVTRQDVNLLNERSETPNREQNILDDTAGKFAKEVIAEIGMNTTDDSSESLMMAQSGVIVEADETVKSESSDGTDTLAGSSETKKTAVTETESGSEKIAEPAMTTEDEITNESDQLANEKIDVAESDHSTAQNNHEAIHTKLNGMISSSEEPGGQGNPDSHNPFQKAMRSSSLSQKAQPSNYFGRITMKNNPIKKKEILESDSSQKYYSIQTGSYVEITNAKNEFKSIIEGLKEMEIDHLRIEKIGKFYSVRLGKFKHYRNALKYLRLNKSRLSEAIILDTYIKDNKLIKSYSNIDY